MLKNVNRRLGRAKTIDGLQVDLSPLLDDHGYAIDTLINLDSANSPAQITGDKNDYDIGDARVLRLSTDATRAITGFARGEDTRHLLVINVGANNLTIKHQNTGSAAANRVLSKTTADFTLGANGVAWFFYDSVTLVWRQLI